MQGKQGNRHLKKNNKSQIKLVMAFIFNYSPTRGSLTLISTHGESHMNTCQGCGNQLSLGHTIFGNVLKLYYYKQEKCLSTCFLWLMFLVRGLFLFLLQQSLQDPLQCLKSLFRVHSVRYFCYSKKGKIPKMSTCHSVSRCTTRYHSLYHSLYHSSVFL